VPDKDEDTYSEPMFSSSDPKDDDAGTVIRKREPNKLLREDIQREKLVQLKRTRAGHASDVSRKFSEFKCALNERLEREARTRLTKLEVAFRAFDEAHHRFVDLAIDIEPEAVEGHREHYDNMARMVREAPFELDVLFKDLTPDDSISQIGSRTSSRGSTTSSAMARASAKKAALLAKAASLKQQHLLQMQIQQERLKSEAEMKDKELKSMMKLEELQLEGEIQAATAEEEVLANMTFAERGLQPRDSQPRPRWSTEQGSQTNLKRVIPEKVLRPEAPDFEPLRARLDQQGPLHGVKDQKAQQNKDDDDLTSVTKTLVNQLMLSRLPAPEPSVFMGEPLKFPSWKASFISLIESRGIASFEALHYLKKYLGGAAKEAVEGLLFINSELAYGEVLWEGYYKITLGPLLILLGSL